MQGTLGLCAWVCGGSEEGGEEEEVRGTAKADSCRGWAVGWATSVSEAYAINVHTHVHEGVASGVGMWSGGAWAGLLSCKLLDAERRTE